MRIIPLYHMYIEEIPYLSPDEKRGLLYQQYAGDFNFQVAHDSIEVILRRIGYSDLGIMEGWSILDLGCGSPLSTERDYGEAGQFEAWFPRVCAFYGARVVGVDYYGQDEKDAGVYYHIQANINTLLVGTAMAETLGWMPFHFIHTNDLIKPRNPGYTYARSAGISVSEFTYGSMDELCATAEMQIANLTEQARALLIPHGILAINQNLSILGEGRLFAPVY